MDIPQIVKEKFEARTTKGSGCWTYHGSWAGIMFQGRREMAHRIAYRIYKGPIPRGLWVLHRCDNNHFPKPPCVNPAHLILGTAQQNQADKFLKGRSCFGEKHWFHKLTEKKVGEIDRLLARGFHPSVLAPRYGVSERTIDRIKYRENWRYLAVAREAR